MVWGALEVGVEKKSHLSGWLFFILCETWCYKKIPPCGGIFYLFQNVTSLRYAGLLFALTDTPMITEATRNAISATTHVLGPV